MSKIQSIRLLVLSGVLLMGGLAQAETCTAQCSLQVSPILAVHQGYFISQEQTDDFTNYCASKKRNASVAYTSDYSPEQGTVYYAVCLDSEPSFKRATGYGYGDGYQARQTARQKCLEKLPQNESIQSGGFLIVGTAQGETPTCY